MNEMKKYYLKLTTLTPVHIGTGEVYEPTNFVIDDGYLYEFDEVLFFRSLNDLQKKEFNAKVGNLFGIIEFYKKNKKIAKKIYEHKVKALKNIQNRYEQQFNKDGTINKNQLHIQKTYKEPNSYLPVIPGSSIKGVLDTILQIYALPEVASNEIRQKLIVSDALCVRAELEIGIALRKYIGSQKKAKGIPINLEIIKENSQFIFEIKTSFSKETIIDGIKKFYNNPKRKSEYVEINNNIFTLRIGKFCGKPYNVYENRDIGNVKTHTVYNDKEFGWVRVEFIPYEKMQENLMNYEKIKNEAITQKEVRQKAIKEFYQQQKQKEKFLQEEQKRKKEQEEQAKQKALQEEKARLAKMSPLDRKIYELQKSNPNPNETIDIILFNAIKRGEFDEIRCEALQRLKEEMIKLKKWVETSKKPEKDKKYKRTQEVKKMLEECKK